MPMRSPNVLLVMFLTVGLIAEVKAADLLELYEQALATHPIIKGSEFSIDQAKAEKDQALSRLLPQVSATGNLSWNDMTQAQGNGLPAVTSNYEGTRGVIQAKQALFDLPSIMRWQGAKAIVLQTEQELEAARMSMAADLIDQYLETLQTEDELGYLQGEKALTESDVKRIRRMHELQLAPVADLYEVEAYYQTLLTKELEVIGAHDIALEKLHETTGITVTTVQKLSAAALPPVPGEINQWVEEGLHQHPSLLALEHAIEGTQKLIYSARAEHLPQLALQLSETYADNGGFDNRQLPHYNIGTVGLQVNVPIYSGGGTEAGTRDAIARYHQTREQRNGKIREIEKEIRTAYVQARTGFSRISSTGKEVEAREKARDAQVKSYELGVTTVVDMLESKKNLLKTQFEYAQSRYDFIRSLVALKLWSGSLKGQDVEEINQWLVQM
jgi:outer membrane protein